MNNYARQTLVLSAALHSIMKLWLLFAHFMDINLDLTAPQCTPLASRLYARQTL